ncbi:Vgb family protein [Rhodococcus sp. P1Y]|uniref:Vgb family protein n=1 Tax=Rhodococcus sp. P1Y TaxID=1302308 RepID=UPI000EAB88C5|nr:SMP-30/gluconolactonase/LRE family protein [Rhodococcus sp. P1Y]AYJ50359.1 gluconolaconase [Rhodococcus sp. P1Y]
MQLARYTNNDSIDVGEGWSVERLTSPSRLFGANGIRTGADGRIYVAQVAGSQISAFDVETGQLETISAMGGDIVAPDDVAFDPAGDMYVTEYYNGRVSVRGAAGGTRTLRDDLPGVNGITFHQGRLFVNECRIGGRLMELDLAGGAPRVLLDNLPMPNAMEVGPDGLLYYPMLGTNEIWRIDPEGGEPQRVVGDLGVPDAVKFDSEGFIVSTQVASGEVLRINPRNGDRTVLASLTTGLDNLTFVGDRLFVSNITGQITEILGGGETRTALPDGLTWPLDLTAGPDGTVYIADGAALVARTPDGELRDLGRLFSPGYPTYVRGVAVSGDGEFVCTGNGAVARYRPALAESEVLADGFDQLYGVAVSSSGVVAVADMGAGKVYSVETGGATAIATGLCQPVGVAFTPSGTCLVSEAGAGRVAAIRGSGVDTVIDGLGTPHGIVVHEGWLYIVDVEAKTLIRVDLESKEQQTLARNLPVGAPEGVTPKPLLGLPPVFGPQGPFTGLAVGPGGVVYVSADAEGSVLAIRQNPQDV